MRGLILYVLIFLTLLSCTSISDSIIIEGKVSGLENLEGVIDVGYKIKKIN